MPEGGGFRGKCLVKVMSCYWTFYVIKKNEDNTYDYAGALSDGHVVPLECRSRSFINGDTFRAWNHFSIDQLTSSAKKALFGKEEITNDDVLGVQFTFIPFVESIFEATDDILTRGYVSIDEFDIITQNNYDPDFLRYEADIKKSEYIAALPEEQRRNYVPLTWMDRCSDSYIYETIRHGCDMLAIYPFDSSGTYYILCEIG